MIFANRQIFAKRSVVSAANYAERSSFAKDQILFFLSIEVIPHENEVFLHTTKIFANNQFFAYNLFLSAVVSSFCCFDTWILYRHAQLIKIGTWESSNWLGHSHKKKTAKSDVWLPP